MTEFQKLFNDQLIKNQNYNALIVAGIPCAQASRIAFGNDEARRIEEALLTAQMKIEINKLKNK